MRVLFPTIFTVFMLILVSCRDRQADFRGNVVTPVQAAPNFALRTADGESFELNKQTGKIILLFFGFTNCPDICPATLNIWRRVSESLRQFDDQILYVFITVDPDRDNDLSLRNYVKFNEKMTIFHHFFVIFRDFFTIF